MPKHFQTIFLEADNGANIQSTDNVSIVDNVCTGFGQGPSQEDTEACENYTVVKEGTPGGGLGLFTDRDQRSTFWALNFQNLFFWALIISAVIFELSNKCCIFKVHMHRNL